MDKNRYLHSLQHLSTIRVSVELGLCVQVSGEPADYLLTQSIPGETERGERGGGGGGGGG